MAVEGQLSAEVDGFYGATVGPHFVTTLPVTIIKPDGSESIIEISIPDRLIGSNGSAGGTMWNDFEDSPIVLPTGSPVADALLPSVTGDPGAAYDDARWFETWNPSTNYATAYVTQRESGGWELAIFEENWSFPPSYDYAPLAVIDIPETGG